MERSVAYSLLNFPIIFGQCTANISSVSVLQIYLRSVYCKYIFGQCTARISSVSVLQIYLRSVYCKYIFGKCIANISSVYRPQIIKELEKKKKLYPFKNCFHASLSTLFPGSVRTAIIWKVGQGQGYTF